MFWSGQKCATIDLLLIIAIHLLCLAGNLGVTVPLAVCDTLESGTGEMSCSG